MPHRLRPQSIVDILPGVSTVDNPVHIYAAYFAEEGGMDVGLILDLDPIWTVVPTSTDTDLSTFIAGGLKERTFGAQRALAAMLSEDHVAGDYVWFARKRSLEMRFARNTSAEEQERLRPLLTSAIVLLASRWPAWAEALGETQPDLAEAAVALRRGGYATPAPEA